MQEKYNVKRQVAPAGAKFIEFSATTRMSGVDIGTRKLRKGAIDSVLKFAREQAGRDVPEPPAFRAAVDKIARSGGTPLGLVEGGRILGVIHLKDVIKPDVKERFAALRRMGIKTVMITGDNPVTAAAIASEAGVDDFIAQATPEDKLRYIRGEQMHGRLIAADVAQLVLGRGLGDEIVHTGFRGDRRRRHRIVAGDHHSLDAHAAQRGEALLHVRLDDVLQVDHAEDTTALDQAERGAARGQAALH